MKVYTLLKAYASSDILTLATDNKENALNGFNDIKCDIEACRCSAIGIYIICWEDGQKPTVIREWYKN